MGETDIVIGVRLATRADAEFLRQHEHDIDPVELGEIQRRGRILVAEVAGQTAGWLRWGLFWDSVPFMNMLFVFERYRGLGVGRRLVGVWEQQTVDAGRTMVLTSRSPTSPRRTSTASWVTSVQARCCCPARSPRSSCECKCTEPMATPDDWASGESCALVAKACGRRVTGGNRPLSHAYGPHSQ